jgi:LacI family transcriptional regulator
MSKPPSLQHVAKAAGLSPATVSRYLNGSLVLPKETAARIDAAIAALNYRPNPHARSLSRGKSDTIGLVIPDIANPFFARLAAAVEKYADAAGIALMLCSTLNRPERELDYVERLRRNYVDGLLFTTNHQDENGALAAAINASANIVVMDEDVDDAVVPKVFSDNIQGGALAARHLVEMGHRSLAHIGGPADIMSARERAQGFSEALAGSGAEIAAALYGAYTAEHGQKAMETLLDSDRGVTAVFAGSDEILYGMMQVLRDRSIRVGEEMSVITFDDAGRLELFDPPITAIRQSTDEIGRLGVETLMRRMSGDADLGTQRVPVELIIRASVKRLA